MSRRLRLRALRALPLDKGDSEPMRTRSRRAAPSLGLALALGLTATVPAWAQTTTTPPAPVTPSTPVNPTPAPASTAPAAAPRSSTSTPLRLTLPEATALALRQQPTIRSAQGSLTAAQARIPQARSSYFPRIDLLTGVQTSEFKSSTTGNRQRSESTFATRPGPPAHLRLRQDRGAGGRGAGREPGRVGRARAGAGPGRPERPAVVLRTSPGEAARRCGRRRARALRAQPAERPGILRRRHEAEVRRDASRGRGGERAGRRDPRPQPRSLLGDEPGQRARARGDGAHRDRRHP